MEALEQEVWMRQCFPERGAEHAWHVLPMDRVIVFNVIGNMIPSGREPACAPFQRSTSAVVVQPSCFIDVLFIARESTGLESMRLAPTIEALWERRGEHCGSNRSTLGYNTWERD